MSICGFSFLPEGKRACERKFSSLSARIVSLKSIKIALGLQLDHFFAALVVFWRVLHSFRPNVVILSLKQTNIIGRFILLFLPRVYCIAFEHIARLEAGHLLFLYEALLRVLSFRVNEVWADCETTLRESSRYYPWSARRRESIVPLFVATSLPVKRDYGIKGRARLVMAGRLVPRKRADLAVRALAILSERGIDAVCTIFGSGPCERAILDQAAALGVADRLRFKGFVERWWCEADQHDIFVQVSDEEGFCIAAAEAMMAGLPIVATPVGGIKDYTKHDVTAVHVPRGNPEALAGALQTLIGDHSVRQRIGIEGSAQIRETFDVRQVSESYYGTRQRLFDCSGQRHPHLGRLTLRPAHEPSIRISSAFLLHATSPKQFGRST